MKLTIGDVEFGYDRSGSGEPLILVMGLGTPRIGWLHQTAFFSQHYDVVSFDNRGCGETVCEGQWSMADMAADVLALADGFGFETFHLAGISMGGMISQEVVLTAPQRVRSVALLSTTPGGPRSVPMSPEFTAAMTHPDPQERTQKTIELTFGERYRRENPEMMDLIISAATSGVEGFDMLGSSAGGAGSPGFFGQVLAVVNWMASGGAADRLSSVEVPSLVLHGGDDLLLPVDNGHIIAGEIPGARLRVWEDAGHALNHEYAEEVNAELLAHLQSTQALV
jgi:pimeloyl-ACP methyl ester carboxylesterase